MTSPSKPLLVVDDEENNRDMLRRRLERAGFRVETANDGRDAFAKIQRQSYELILLDSMMPNMNGIDLLHLLRGTYSQTELPVIMVTALNEGEKLAEALAAGANDYITKPVDFVAALARIRAQLGRRKTEEALRESEERYSLAARGANDGLWDWDLRTNRLYLSARWKEMLGFLDSEVPNDPSGWFGSLHEDDSAALQSQLLDYRLPGGPTELIAEYRVRCKDGSLRWMLSRGVILRNEHGEAVRIAGSQTDVTNNKAFDPLTGLPNRTLFLDSLGTAFKEAAAGQRASFTVMFLDLDRFKNVNDSLGHNAGDHLLVEISRRLNQGLRSVMATHVARGNDIIARLGGDEFAVLLPGVDLLPRASSIAERLQQAIRRPVHIEGREIYTSASIGIALWNKNYSCAPEILRDADTAMYQAKIRGKAQYAVFDEEMRAEVIQRLEIETDLQRAIENCEFTIHYQPKLSLFTGVITGFEALLRWNHPRLGNIPPARFIPIAEETGQIVPIGEWVLRNACATMRRFHLDHPTLPPLEIAVNLSPRQFRNPELVASIEAILADTGLDPHTLKLEITESILIDDLKSAQHLLHQLKDLHVGLDIDDFGTGYSSLSSLTNLPVNCLKIDRSFVLNMFNDQQSSEVIRAVVSLASQLGMKVVAEGIETREQLEGLQKLGCEFGQGYLFAAPLNEQATEQLIADMRNGSNMLTRPAGNVPTPVTV